MASPLWQRYTSRNFEFFVVLDRNLLISTNFYPNQQKNDPDERDQNNRKFRFSTRCKEWKKKFGKPLYNWCTLWTFTIHDIISSTRHIFIWCVCQPCLNMRVLLLHKSINMYIPQYMLPKQTEMNTFTKPKHYKLKSYTFSSLSHLWSPVDFQFKN